MAPWSYERRRVQEGLCGTGQDAGGAVMNKIHNRQVVCETLMELAKEDRDIVVLCSDSRGSASMKPFAEKYPGQFIEVGIAEQNIVGIAAGLAASGKKPFVASLACFLTARAAEQIKVDVSYSKTNVKLLGISAGISYGALGMSHHSLQDIALIRAIPNILIVVPADRFETRLATEAAARYDGPVYMRLGRNPVEDVYTSSDYEFQLGRAITMRDGDSLSIITFGETVRIALDAAELMAARGINCRVINMHTIKPLDEECIIRAAKETGAILTIEEHSILGGFGAAVAEVVVQNYPVSMKIMGIPDEPAVPGKSKEVFAYYGISPENLCDEAEKLIKKKKAGE
ncbi:putative transketolase C-terminal section [Thermoclostridium stercorarium subsp. stercorarium DSM 8532]|nr:putative transketolase C-terminal section [Thermoclostridium stercorarium subsp. stercorarium DSM 8532]